MTLNSQRFKLIIWLFNTALHNYIMQQTATIITTVRKKCISTKRRDGFHFLHFADFNVRRLFRTFFFCLRIVFTRVGVCRLRKLSFRYALIQSKRDSTKH